MRLSAFVAAHFARASATPDFGTAMIADFLEFCSDLAAKTVDDGCGSIRPNLFLEGPSIRTVYAPSGSNLQLPRGKCRLLPSRLAGPSAPMPLRCADSND